MGVKIDFYAENENKKQCIYNIQAGEICSEFIARYFNKTETERYI